MFIKVDIYIFFHMQSISLNDEDSPSLKMILAVVHVGERERGRDSQRERKETKRLVFALLYMD